MNSTDPAWLLRLRDEMSGIAQEAAREYWPGPTPEAPPYYNYRLEHVRQVERDALALLEQIPGDREIVLAAVWIHDRFQPQFTGDDHGPEAAGWAQAELAAMGFPPGKVERVCYAVANHSQPPGVLPPEAVEARILWDADKLSKIGALSVASFFCALPAFPAKQVTFARIGEVGLSRLDDKRELVEAFYFDSSRARAGERLRAEESFYRSLVRELYPSDPGAA